MKITINNIGPIVNTSIECKGLTIITGKNRSGKSTIVKSLSAIYLGINNFFEHNIEDAKSYVARALDDCFNQNGLSVALYLDLDALKEREQKLFNNVILLSTGKLDNINDIGQLVNCVDKAYKEIMDNRDSFDKTFDGDFPFRRRYKNYKSTKEFDAISDKVMLQLRNCKESIVEFNNMGPAYYINEELRLIFKNQVENKNSDNKEKPSLKILEGKYMFNHTYDDYKNKKWSFPFRTCLYINNSDILDNIGTISFRDYKRSGNGHISVNPYIQPLTNQLIEILSKKPNPVIENQKSKQFEDVLKIIKSIVDYDFSIDNNVAVTTDGGIAIANEASGVKTFLLLKRLLLSGSIDESSLLIFDEPENHLHPEWQEVFARVISLLSSKHNIDIILITHSPTLLLAFDSIARKNNDDRLRVYCSSKLKDNSYIFEDLTDNISRAHYELNETYINIDLLGE